MLETDEQRRWWFANHPEYSSSRKGKKREQDQKEKAASQEKVSPEAVDAYVDNAVQYMDEDAADFLKSFKQHFGTEAREKEAAKPDAAHASARTQPISDRRGAQFRQAAAEPTEPPPKGAAAKKPPVTHANPGSGWDEPARAGEPEFPEFTTPERLQLFFAGFLDWLQQKKFDLDQARKHYAGDYRPGFPGGFNPSKKPSYGDVPEAAKRFMRNIPSFGGQEDEESKKKTEKVVKGAAKALDTVQQFKDTLKKLSGKEKEHNHPSKKGIPKIGGRRPLNHKLAGKRHPVTGAPYTE